MDKSLGVTASTKPSEQKTFTNLPKGLTLDDMSFWLKYREEINYAQPTPFSVPQQKKPSIKAKATKKKDQPLIEEIDEKSKSASATKVFCVKRKRNEEPLETFYIPSIQQSKKTKMSDLEKQFASTSLNKKKDSSSFSLEPSFSLYKFTIVKSEKKVVEEKTKLSEQSSLKQVTNIKAKTTERTKAHESDMKKKRMLRISEMRNEGNKQIVELQVLSGEQTEKKEEKVDLSNYASMLDEIYGKGATESMQNICDNEFEVDYYTVETCTKMDDIDSENYEDQQNVLRFERFDDQLWLESNLEDEYGFAQDDEYDSEDSNASGNPNNEYPDDEDSEEGEDEHHRQNNYNYNDIYGYPDDEEEEWDDEEEEEDDDGMDDFGY
ncbi:predicted protein [Naegleria gruberi]|uniref:Predicted protein n=1 Tax=Naegleria gruberi TaxID=5762 RepID=D2VIS5_NAEGR|nr:uncharacterized protein NAEGRDRAFT_49881 [Naegleria gruberi]EFC43401.1 predicted protein [Naegleria gruberi]|eukprot:XP_002676145.1 predicted protein [Naegleria gruberi strain NEG-M]